MKNIDIIIIGGGPAGLAAAISAYENGAKDILILERESTLGGILQQCIHNGFGLQRFEEELTGPEYAQRYIDKVNGLAIPYKCDTMVLDVSSDKVVTTISPEEGLVQYKAKAIVLAMGCRERPRGALGIPGSRCAGIYSAGTAQRFVNLEGYLPGKEIVILGSGDIGLIMARRMTFEGCSVKACVELMPFSGGLTRNIVQCLNDYDIPLYLSHTVVKIWGKDRLEGVTIAQVDENKKPILSTQQFIPCDTLLLSVGLIPENELSVGAGVEISPTTSGPVVDQNLSTNISGIFATGNVLHVHDLVDYVSLESEQAGKQAALYINSSENAITKNVAVTAGFGVSALVPQLVDMGNLKEDITFMFRPNNIYKLAKVVIEIDGEKAVVTKPHMIMAPGEIALATLPLETLSKHSNPTSIKVSLEVKQ